MYKIWIKSKKDLKIRHITMISIGVIGAGLFVGSGAVVHSAGMGSIVSYALAGLLVIFVMRMLGEMATVNPTSGSFATYAREAIGVGGLYNRLVILVLGNCYCNRSHSRCWYYQYWIPQIPLWLLSLILTILLTLTNVFR